MHPHCEKSEAHVAGSHTLKHTHTHTLSLSLSRSLPRFVFCLVEPAATQVTSLSSKILKPCGKVSACEFSLRNLARCSEGRKGPCDVPARGPALRARRVSSCFRLDSSFHSRVDGELWRLQGRGFRFELWQLLLFDISLSCGL